MLVRPWRDRRLDAYVGAAIGTACCAVVSSRPSLVGISAGLAAAALVGTRERGSVEVTAAAAFSTDQVVAGDEVTGVLTITRPAALAAEIVVSPRDGIVALEPAGGLRWRLPPGTDVVELPFRVRLDRWGRHRLGEVGVRLDDGASLLHWAGTISCAGDIRVIPTADRLKRLLEPRASRVTAGAHLSRQVGSGSDFAEIREYQPGDRRRDINWRASSRSGRVMVNRRHPDRGGDVIVLVDTAADAYETSSTASQAVLTRMAQAAWAVANVHLASADRVGFLAFGKVGAYLSPATGARAKQRLMESLLSVGGAVAAGEAIAPPDPTRVVPPSALVIGVSPLTTHVIIDTLRELRARGRNVVCIVPDLGDALPAAMSESDQLARRLWQAGIANRIRLLQEVGIAVERWPKDAALGPVIRSLRQAQARRPAGLRR